LLLLLKAFSDQVELLTAETGSPLRSQRGAQQDSPHTAQALERCEALTRCPDRLPASLSSPLEFVRSVSCCFSKVGLLGITPVIVPDNDFDHRGTVYEGEEQGELFTA
jgi:hypothetical protein